MPSSDVVHAYLFEAKGVQRYLFAGGRLRDAVGASDLVARIALPTGDDLIGDVLGKLTLKIVEHISPGSKGSEVSFSRRAGAVFCLHCSNRDTLVAVRRTIRRRVMLALPGLEIADSLGAGADEIASLKSARDNAGGFRANLAARVLPLGRPVMRIVPQTGLPGVASTGYGDKLDAIVAPQRDRADELQKRMIAETDARSGRLSLDGAAERFHHDKPHRNLAIAYPRRFELDDDESPDALKGNPLFPLRDRGAFLGRDSRIALVHADVSGLGEGFARFESGSAKALLDKGNAIDAAILAAVKEANREVIRDHCEPDDYGRAIAPARPLVIGGDDMTFIVRADLALRFTARLLELIEELTPNMFGDGRPLSACAGVAVVNRKLPFLTANALAESLCKHAKKVAKTAPREPTRAWPSLLSFHVQTQTAEEDYADDVLPTLKTPDGRWLTANPYAADKESAAASKTLSFDTLTDLAKAIDALSGGFAAVRKIRGELANGRLGVARGLWRRLYARAETQDALKVSLHAILGKDATSTDIPDSGALFDALALIDLGACAPPEPLLPEPLLVAEAQS